MKRHHAPIITLCLAAALALVACDRQATPPVQITPDDQPTPPITQTTPDDQLNTLLADLSRAIAAAAPAADSPAAARIIQLGRFINNTPSPAARFAAFRTQTQRRLEALAPNHNLILSSSTTRVAPSAYQLHAAVMPLQDNELLITWTLTGPAHNQTHTLLWTDHTTAPAP